MTLEEEPHGEEEGTDMLLVIPRAELLQVGTLIVKHSELKFIIKKKNSIHSNMYNIMYNCWLMKRMTR